MNIPDSFHEDFIVQVVEGGHYVVPQILEEEEIPRWDMFIHVLDRAARRHYSNLHEGQPLMRRRVNDAVFTGVHHVDVTLSGEDMRDLEPLQPLWNLLRKTTPGFHMFEFSQLNITLIGGAPESSRDRYVHDQCVYVQCQGVSQWRVFTEDDPRAEIDYIELKPGDMLFAGSKYYYSVLTPDASAIAKFTIQHDEN